jgi:hypothetical protein
LQHSHCWRQLHPLTRNPPWHVRPQRSWHPRFQPTRPKIGTCWIRAHALHPGLGLWRHRTKHTTFALCIDNFGVKCFPLPNAMHLINTIKAHYDLTIDWTGKLCCGLALDGHYDEGYIDISMPGYVTQALKKFNHPAPLCPQYTPHQWIEPAYGSRKPQSRTSESQAQLLDKHGTTRIQAINGTFMYYGRTCDLSMKSQPNSPPHNRHHRPSHHAHGLPPHLFTRRPRSDTTQAI